MLLKNFIFILLFSPVLSYGPLKELLDGLFQNYDGGIRPYYGEKPVKVGLGAKILSISNIDTDKQEITASMFLRQSWNDPRLKFKKTPGIGVKKSNDTIVLDQTKSSLIWLPDTFVVNEKTSFVHKLIFLNEYVRLGSEGDVFRSERVTLTAGCPMDLQYFPMDQQSCSIQFESYGYTAYDIEYFWSKGLAQSVGIVPTLTNPEFLILGHRLVESRLDASSGNYSKLALEIHFKRAYGKYITRYYTPLTMFVSISILALWLSRPEIGTIICFMNVGFINLFMAMSLAGGLKRDNVKSALDDYVSLCLYHIYICLIVSMLNLYFASNRKNQSQSFELRSLGRIEGIAADDMQNLCENENQTRQEIPNSSPIWRHLATVKRITEMVCGHFCWILLIVFPVSILIYWIVVWASMANWVPHEDFVPTDSYRM